MKEKKILADLHTHTVKSGHAYSTIEENIRSGESNNMTFVAITDHIYNDGTYINMRNEMAYFTGLPNVEPEGVVHMIGGIEGNLSHRLNVEPNEISKINNDLKWRLVGIHSWFLEGNNRKLSVVPTLFEDTLLYAGNPEHGKQIVPTAFAHIERDLELFSTHTGDTDADIHAALADIVDIAVANDIFLEINDSSIARSQELRNRMRFWIRYAVDSGAKFCFGSDAHSSELVGRFWALKEFLDEVDLGNSYVLNYDREALISLVNIPR